MMNLKINFNFSVSIVMLGPAAPLLAGRMIGLGVFIRKQRPNSYLVFLCNFGNTWMASY